jgi:hypothetical protein
MRRFLLVLVSASVLAGAGCSRAAVPPSPPSPTPPSTPPASPTPSASFDSTMLAAYVSKAALTSKEVGTAKAKKEEFTAFFEIPCAAKITLRRVAEQAWSYSSVKGGFLGYAVGAFAPDPGSAVVDQVRTILPTCSQWRTAELAFTMVGELKVGRPAGADNSISFCYRLKYLTGQLKGRTIAVCDGLVSRGNLAAEVGTYDENLSDAQQRLKKFVPLAAAALTRAVPES